MNFSRAFVFLKVNGSKDIFEDGIQFPIEVVSAVGELLADPEDLYLANLLRQNKLLHHKAWDRPGAVAHP